MYPKKFENLIDCLRKLPGVGLKSAERYAFDMLDYSDEDIEAFIESLQGLKDSIHRCERCGNLAEDTLCDICKDESRNQKVIFVVQNPKDVVAMEKTNEYHGLYHVLNGVISTSKGVMPEDINLASLLERLNDQVEEVIIATNPTVEGETTALYISKLLENKNITVTRIAHGLPMGGHLDYADELTLIKALEGRNKMK
ncbi:recombination protein RecR [Breznakia sp. PF5-3]|uniref:recombination mediator RecR n=1 Tax=unclassified Breznakia TaxID=2623764 RepID=UPI0024067F76|nr:MULTISPECIES: recombination mediator RecR [unclassified Breznakia]MDF9824321.1 recombination protein RecR [Breznakia sp. PM6-1]MDF9835088.1 recombination protein RecR [Breznakia sp. PF5-3]MDF9838460.1 recombination protein RecR [Breznakia sp. PFB2-8]MDF9860518.1 recombination protein RecR [Breznakia sp. PH5-24]